MNFARNTMLRDLVAFLVVAAACPIAMYPLTTIGCAGEGITFSCAMSVVYISPVVLVAAGVIAGLVTYGWTGLLIGFLANLAGMVLILVLTYGAGDPVPLDPFIGILAMGWFGLPSLTGYGATRAAFRLREMRRAKATA
jgi:hypothetical protein